MTPLTRRQSNALRMAADRARLAPSVQNCQPWQFQLHPDRLELWVDPHRRPPALDPRGRESLLSVGAALFNARVGMASVRRAATVDRFPDPRRELLAAVVRPAGSHPDPALAALAPLVDLRHSTRRGYVGPPQPEVVTDLLAAAAAEDTALVPVAPDRRHLLARWGVRPGRAANDACLVLATAADCRSSWLRAGEALERVLLEGVRHGCQAAVLSLRPDRAATEATSERLLPAGLHPQVILRVGRAEPGPGSPRRRVIDVLRDLTMLPPSRRESSADGLVPPIGSRPLSPGGVPCGGARAADSDPGVASRHAGDSGRAGVVDGHGPPRIAPPVVSCAEAKGRSVGGVSGRRRA